MPSLDRRFDRGTRRALRAVFAIGEEIRETRLAGGLSQGQVAEAVRISRAHYSRIEAGKIDGLRIVDASRIASMLGLDLVIRLYPGGDSLRDFAQQARLERLVGELRPPLTYRTEVPLPALPDHTEQRAWDAELYGGGKRTAVEVEMRIRDGQAVERRIALKRRDDPTDRFLLVVADTRANRRVLTEHPGLFPDLPRLSGRVVLAAARAGQHPPTGLVLL